LHGLFIRLRLFLGLKILQENRLHLRVQVRLRLFDDECFVGRIGVEGELAQNNRHIDEVVVSQAVLLDI
jgi:hypothetical protein